MKYCDHRKGTDSCPMCGGLPKPEADQFYLQDKRTYVGNDLLFWAKNGKGYTTDLHKAHIYTKEEAFKQNQMRETDVPWPKEYIDSKVRPAVDHQYVDIKEALGGLAGELYVSPPPPKDPPLNCAGCGRFLSKMDRYTPCDNCETYNGP